MVDWTNAHQKPDMRNAVAARPAPSSKKTARAQRHFDAGVAARQGGRLEEAIIQFRSAVDMAPNDARCWLVLGNALRLSGDLAAAEEAARNAVRLDPGSELAARLLASVLDSRGRHVDAAKVIGALASDSLVEPDAFIEAGRALQAARRYPAAIEQFMQALRRSPGAVQAHLGLGDCFAKIKAPQAAYECFRTASLLRPGDPNILTSVVHQALHAARWESLTNDVQALRRSWAGHPRAAAPFALMSIPGITAQELRDGTREFAQKNRPRDAPLPARQAGRRPGRIRVGYMSSEFNTHATAFLVADVLELHDRTQFEVFLYCYSVDDGSDLRHRIQARSEHFIELRERSLREMAERIRADDIDILVDLKGHTFASRTQVCAYRPAPIQVNYLGFPGTLGSSDVDYIITDGVVSPLERAEDYDEKLAQMPDCYQPNSPWKELPAPGRRADHGLPDTGFVFCCFNNLYKITPDVFDIWCRLLKEVPGSVLWLLDFNLEAKANLMQAMEARGVSRDRLVLAPFAERQEHLRRTQLADLFLDTAPVNAHTTASDALRAGVPLVTVPGETFVSRVAASLLTAVGLHDCILPSWDAYYAKALELAVGAQACGALRERLRRSLRDGPALFDAERYVRHLEALLGRMFERLQDGRRPDHLLANPGE